MKINKLFSLILLAITSGIYAQNSINIYGNRSSNHDVTNIAKCEDGFLAFGTTDQLGVQHFDMDRGNDWSMYFYQQNGTNRITLQGTGGIMENDSVFVVLGRATVKDVVVIKATTSGRILWSNWYSLGTDEHPDKIIRLKNGDYLISVRTNVDYYEFGEWGSHAAIFRISPDGDLLWNRLLDYRSANTSSLVLNMHENNHGDIIISQSYSTNLGLFKLSANGDSLNSLISTANFVAISSEFDPQSQNLYILSSDRKIICLDSQFNNLWSKQLTSSNLNSTSQIRILNDTVLAIGCSYLNYSAILITDKNAKASKCFYRKSGTNNGTFAGIFRTDSFLFSMMQGYAVTQHPQDLGQSCYNVANGSLFTTSNITPLVFKGHVKIEGTATWDAFLNVFTQKSFDAIPSSNCKTYDLGVQPDKKVHNNTCNNVPLKLYITNHGTVGISSLHVTYYYQGTRFDTTMTISPLGLKSSVFINVSNIQLIPGKSILTGRINLPNNNQDEFVFNDTFSIEFNTRDQVVLHIEGNDSICPGANTTLKINGKPGNYAWYKFNSQQKQGPDTFLNVSAEASYHVIFTDSGCVYYSDTFHVGYYPIPAKPTITENLGMFTTDAVPTFYWYYNNKFTDSNKTTIKHYGAGNYKVRAINYAGCTNESNVFSFSTSVQNLTANKFVLIRNNKDIFWNTSSAGFVKIITLDGKIIEERLMHQGEVIQDIPTGIYLLQIHSNDETITTRIYIQ